MKEVATVARTTKTAPQIAKRDAKRRAGYNVAFLTLAMFLTMFALLTWRLQTGQDPVIGKKLAQTTTQPVIQRKLIIHRKVVTIIADAPTSNSTASGTGSGTASSGSAPASTYSAPQTISAPAPAPAPAPATSAS